MADIKTEQLSTDKIATDNKAAYAAILAANAAMREAIAVASMSPIPYDLWNEYGRAMQLQERIRVGLKPRTGA